MEEENSIGQVRLHVRKGEVAVEVEGPKEYAEQRFEELCQDHFSESSQSSSGNENDVSDTSSEKSRSLTEVLREADTSIQRDNFLVIGWYLEKHKGKDSFTKSELEEESESSKVRLGKNLTRDVKEEIKKGHLDEVGKREGEETYHLTLTGEEYVEEELNASLSG